MSPLLDKTERLDIDAEYGSNFDDCVLSGIIFSELEPPTYFGEVPGDALVEINAAEAEAGGNKLVEFDIDYLVSHPEILPDLPRDVVVPFGNQFTEIENQFFADLQHKEYLTYAEPLEATRAQNEEKYSFGVPDFELSLYEDKFLLLNRGLLFTARVLKWLPGITLMIVLAIGHAAFFKMSGYAQVPEYRLNYVLVCRYLGCEVPEYENYDELRTRELVYTQPPLRVKSSLGRCHFS